MNAADLIAKLVEIERASDSAGLTHLHHLALDAQQDFFRIEQQMMEVLLENQRLLECLEMSAYGFEFGAEPGTPADGDTVPGRWSARLVSDRTRRKLGPFWIN
jgi:hypothetical protein